MGAHEWQGPPFECLHAMFMNPHLFTPQSLQYPSGIGPGGGMGFAGAAGGGVATGGRAEGWGAARWGEGALANGPGAGAARGGLGGTK